MIKFGTVLPCDRVSSRGLKVVAKIGGDSDWAAYEGPLGWTDSEIGSNGDKISALEARQLFPELDSIPYRE